MKKPIEEIYDLIVEKANACHDLLIELGNKKSI